MGKAAAYPPLELLKKTDFSCCSYNALVNYAKANGGHYMDGISRDEFVSFCCNPEEFMSPDCSEKYRGLNELLYAIAPQILSKSVQENIRNGTAALATEMKDLVLAIELWYRWSLNKQVYLPDPCFAKALIGTDNIQLTKETLEHLPVNTFYVDLSASKEFLPIIGGLVNVENYGEHAAITVYLLTEKLEFFSFYCGGTFDETGVFDINSGTLPRVLPDEDAYDVIYPSGKVKKYSGITYTRRQASMYCILMLCYLGSRKPEIEESPRTKSTYRKPKPGIAPKQKFSEIEMHDVGIRYGASIRLLSRSNSGTAKENTDDKERKRRKSPAPHFRRAHWQRFWTGKGRKNCEVEWIAPVFVMAEEGKTAEGAAVVHKITY